MWQLDAVLAARMQFLLGLAPALCPAMPPPLLDAILPTASCYTLHPHAPLRGAALDACVAAITALPAADRPAAVLPVVHRALQGFPDPLDAPALRPLLEASLKTMPVGAVQSLQCIEMVVQRGRALTSTAAPRAAGHGDGGMSTALQQLGVLLAVCLLVVDYQVWEAALVLVEEGIKGLDRPAVVLGAMQGVLVAGDDYTRKLRLAGWYNALRQGMRRGVHQNSIKSIAY